VDNHHPEIVDIRPLRSRPCMAPVRRPALAISGNHRVLGLMMKLSFDRRSAARISVDRGALLIFKGQLGTRGCNIIDFSHRGIKLRTHDLPALPILFELTFDNFATMHRCELIWRKGDLIGAAFEN
jgi:hypothetical protein